MIGSFSRLRNLYSMVVDHATGAVRLAVVERAGTRDRERGVVQLDRQRPAQPLLSRPGADTG